MSNMQSKQDNAESFNWYLKTLQEEQKRQSRSPEPDEEIAVSKIESDLLRFIKVFSPSVERLMEFCKTDLETSLLEATKILDKLEKEEEIVIEEISRPTGNPNNMPVVERVVKITSKGLKKI